MNKHFIKNIEIKNFKCFENFKAEGFGRLNLIGGKNNVGKTAFMEAAYVNVYAQDIKSFISSLRGIKFRRENLNILENFDNYNIPNFIEKSNKIFVKSNINKIYFNINEINEGIKKYYFEFKDNIIDINVNEFSFTMSDIDNIEFIDNFGMGYIEIISNYSYLQKKDEENYLNLLLQKFDSSIEAFKIIDKKPQCKVDGEYLEITEFGDGVRHLITIVISLYKSENGYLFIDEIDNGIHYTMLDELWTIILETSKKLNVQVFATTHSKECIESYARVAKKLDDREISFLDMGRKKDGSVAMITMNSKQFQDEIEMTNEVRGW